MRENNQVEESLAVHHKENKERNVHNGRQQLLQI